MNNSVQVSLHDNYIDIRDTEYKTGNLSDIKYKMN